jgi:DNA repair photolyase
MSEVEICKKALQMKIREIHSKSILSPSKIYDYVVNPYVGCQHGCTYCYARFMKRFTGHKEPWGEFVDVKVNAPDLLRREITRKKMGSVWMSGVCDPYQPLEKKYRLSRQCLAILVEHRWPVFIQTRSPLVLRDLDLFRQAGSIEVGMSIATADDAVRQAFEPHAPPIGERVQALASLKRNGIRTYAMIAPILPGAEALMGMLAGKVDYVIVDRMNYAHANKIYQKHGWQDRNTDAYFDSVGRRIAGDCARLGIPCRSAY